MLTSTASADALTAPPLSSSKKNCSFCSLLYFAPGTVVATFRHVLQRSLESKFRTAGPVGTLAPARKARSIRVPGPTSSGGPWWGKAPLTLTERLALRRLRPRMSQRLRSAAR
jgi:hypothetical protein